MGCSDLSKSSVVLNGCVNVLQSQVVFSQEKYHGDTGPEHDTDEDDVVSKPQEVHAYTEIRDGADPLNSNISAIVWSLWTTDCHWNVSII